MPYGVDRDKFMQTWNVRVEPTRVVTKHCFWEKPPQGDVVLNTDGTLQGNNGGWAAVIRDSDGQILAAAKGRSHYRTIALIELQGLEQGLMLALRNNVKRVWAQTDSQNVVSFIMKKEQHPWQANHTMTRVGNMISQLEMFSIKHIYREANSLADRLASNIPNVRCIDIISSSFSEDIRKIVFDDSVGKMYVRM